MIKFKSRLLFTLALIFIQVIYTAASLVHLHYERTTVNEDLQLLNDAIDQSKADTTKFYGQVQQSVTVMDGYIVPALRGIVEDHLSPHPEISTDHVSGMIEQFKGNTDTYMKLVSNNLIVQQEVIKAMERLVQEPPVLSSQTDLLETFLIQLQSAMPVYSNLIRMEYNKIDKEFATLVADQPSEVADLVLADVASIRLDLQVQKILIDNQENIASAMNHFTIEASRQYLGHFLPF